MNADVGTLIGGRYELIERIATGGMGEVWRARDETLDRDVALKVLKREYADEPEFLVRFRAEARHTAGMAHPGIASVFDYGEADDTSYLVMELVAGEPLSKIISRDAPLDPERTLNIVAQTATALDAAHRAGVIHRDVKPGNILIGADDAVKVTDFGIARAADAVPLTRTGTVLGTAHYISPEQANGHSVTPASDVYSLGVVAYECLSGNRPFEASTPVGIAMAHLQEDAAPLPGTVPEPVRTLVAQAMAKIPSERFASAAAFARAARSTLAQLGGTPTEAVAEPATLAFPEPSSIQTAAESGTVHERRRRPTWLIPVALAALAVLLIAAAVVAARQDEVQVPDVRNRTLATATALLEAAGLEVDTNTGFHPTAPKGQVFGQRPDARQVVHEGDTVTIAISKGPQPVVLPGGLIGGDPEDVERRLKALGLVVRWKLEETREDVGQVLRIEPTAGLVAGSTVTVVVGERRNKKDEDKGD